MPTLQSFPVQLIVHSHCNQQPSVYQALPYCRARQNSSIGSLPSCCSDHAHPYTGERLPEQTFTTEMTHNPTLVRLCHAAQRDRDKARAIMLTHTSERQPRPMKVTEATMLTHTSERLPRFLTATRKDYRP